MQKTVVLAVTWLFLAAGCRDDEPPLPAETEGGLVSEVVDAQVVTLVVEDFPIDGDEPAALQRDGAMPAWDAVVDRNLYLARRGQKGVVYGRLDEAVGRYRWLIDETGGAGSLAIRLALPPKPELEVGERLVVWGAWKADAEQHWYWQIDRVARLPAAATESAAADPYASPAGSHEIRTIAERPRGALLVSQRKQAGGIVFEVTREPIRVGDGWTVGDRSHYAHMGLLVLPGEREPYGGQVMLSPDERWTLEREVRYVVKIERPRRRRKGQLPILQAVTAPMRIDPKVK